MTSFKSRAIIRIQAYWRGYRARAKLRVQRQFSQKFRSELVDRYWATWARWTVRMLVLGLKSEGMRRRHESQVRAAAKIQKEWRKWVLKMREKA